MRPRVSLSNRSRISLKSGLSICADSSTRRSLDRQAQKADDVPFADGAREADAGRRHRRRLRIVRRRPQQVLLRAHEVQSCLRPACCDRRGFAICACRPRLSLTSPAYPIRKRSRLPTRSSKGSVRLSTQHSTIVHSSLDTRLRHTLNNQHGTRHPYLSARAAPRSSSWAPAPQGKHRKHEFSASKTEHVSRGSRRGQQINKSPLLRTPKCCRRTASFRSRRRRRRHQRPPSRPLGRPQFFLFVFLNPFEYLLVNSAPPLSTYWFRALRS